jgi:hypothetical protein
MSQLVLPLPVESLSRNQPRERRSLERYACSRRRFVRVLARSMLETSDASIRDFSMKGIGLVLDRCYEPGELLAIQLRSPTAGLSGILTAQVRYATQQRDGRWQVGCSLCRQLTRQEAIALL